MISNNKQKFVNPLNFKIGKACYTINEFINDSSDVESIEEIKEDPDMLRQFSSVSQVKSPLNKIKVSYISRDPSLISALAPS